MNNEIELNMWLLLKQADAQEEWNEQEEQEKEYFGGGFDQFKKEMEEITITNNIYTVLSVMDECFRGQHILRGAFRCGVKLDMYFLKVALKPNGIIMNQREANLPENIFPKVYNYAPDYSWLMTEEAKPFEYEDRIKFFPELKNYTLSNYFKNYDNKFKKIVPNYENFKKKYEGRNIREEILRRWYEADCNFANEDNKEMQEMQNIKPGPYLKRLIDFYNLYPQASVDFKDDNLGVVIRGGEKHPVMIDAGLHTDLYPNVPSSKQEYKKKLKKRKKEWEQRKKEITEKRRPAAKKRLEQLIDKIRVEKGLEKIYNHE